MKYKMIPEKVEGVDLFRIVALKDFGDVKSGDMGGLIENEENLSHDGNCWVYDNAVVLDRARVEDNASVKENAVVMSDARITGSSDVCCCAVVYDRAVIMDNAGVGGCSRVSGKAIISGNAQVFDTARIRGNALVSGAAVVCSNTTVSGNANVIGYSQLLGSGYVTGDAVIEGAAIRLCEVVSGDSYLRGHRDILVFEGPIRGIGRSQIIFTRRKSGGCYVNSNIAEGDIAHFRKVVLESFTPGNPVWDRNDFVRDYYGTPDFLLEIIKFAERHFDIAPRRVEVRKVVKAHGRRDY